MLRYTVGKKTRASPALAKAMRRSVKTLDLTGQEVALPERSEVQLPDLCTGANELLAQELTERALTDCLIGASGDAVEVSVRRH
jgi:hypothetical protein